MSIPSLSLFIDSSKTDRIIIKQLLAFLGTLAAVCCVSVFCSLQHRWMQLGDHPLGKSVTAVWGLCLDGARPSVIAKQHPVPFQGGHLLTPVPIFASPEHTKPQFSTVSSPLWFHICWSKWGKSITLSFQTWIFHGFALIPEQMAAAAAARRPLMASCESDLEQS